MISGKLRVCSAAICAGLFAAIPLLPAQMMAHAQPVAADGAEQAFARLMALGGEWSVNGIDQLTIVFEPAAGGSVLVERWMVGDRLHSMTVYQIDGAAVLATHYCPQGNTPRLAASGDALGDLHFTFRDAVDLDTDSEEWVQDLWFRFVDVGTVLRGETYRSLDAVGEENVLKLNRQD